MFARRRFVRGLAAVVACSVVGHGRSVSAHTSSTDTVVCPVDGTKIVIQVTRSMTTFGAYRDFQKKGAIGSYYADLVHACPTCRFAGYGADFAKPVSAETRKWVLGVLRPKWIGKTPSQAEESEITAERYTFEKAKSEPIGNLYLVASYHLRGANGPLDPKRKGYQRAAAKHFLQALAAAGEVEPDQRAPLTYLVAELERRVGDHVAAIAHFDEAALDPKKPAWLDPIIAEQRALAVRGDANNDV